MKAPMRSATKTCCANIQTLLLMLCVFAVYLLPAPDAEAWPKRKKKQNRIEETRSPYSESGHWEAYFRNAEGKTYALQEPIEKHEDLEWMFLQFSEFNGNRSRMAIWQVDDRIGARTQEKTQSIYGWETTTRSSTIPLASIEELLTASMFNTNRFDLVERKQLEAILAEQNFGATDRVTEQSAAQLGKALGADYVLFVAVNEWTPRKKSMGTIGFKKTVAEVALSFKLVDSETGKLTFAETVRAQAAAKSLNVPFFGSQDSSPINYAMTACINKAAYQLANSLTVKPWSGAVADVDGDLVTINGGENRGVTPGMIFHAVSRGREMIDPTTGLALGYQEDVIGTLRVTTVHEMMATAVVVDGCTGLKVGDYVRPLKTAQSAKAGDS